MSHYRFGIEEYDAEDHLPIVWAGIMDEQDFQSHEEWEAWLDENQEIVEAYTKELSE